MFEIMVGGGLTLIQGRVYVQYVWVKSNYTLLPTDHFFNTTEKEVMTKSTNNITFFPSYCIPLLAL